jgi:hypothetical protein
MISETQPPGSLDPAAENRTLRPAPNGLRWLIALVALSLLAVAIPKLSFPACFLTLVGFLAVPRNAAELGATQRTARRALLLVAALASSAALLRFVLVEAIPGVVAGGRTAIEKQAVSFLRTIVTAEDRARSLALWDPDADGVGSALSLRELAALVPLPDGRDAAPVPLALRPDELMDSALGPAVRHAGYLVALCLPVGESAWSAADPSSRNAERAERQYHLYAWPEALGAGSPTTAYFVDQDERILMLPNTDTATRYVGSTRPPHCDAALGTGAAAWQVWNKKQPRAALPGAG